jgi:hypothetical protein
MYYKESGRFAREKNAASEKEDEALRDSLKDLLKGLDDDKIYKQRLDRLIELLQTDPALKELRFDYDKLSRSVIDFNNKNDNILGKRQDEKDLGTLLRANLMPGLVTDDFTVKVKRKIETSLPAHQGSRKDMEALVMGLYFLQPSLDKNSGEKPYENPTLQLIFNISYNESVTKHKKAVEARDKITGALEAKQIFIRLTFDELIHLPPLMEKNAKTRGWWNRALGGILPFRKEQDEELLSKIAPESAKGDIDEALEYWVSNLLVREKDKADKTGDKELSSAISSAMKYFDEYDPVDNPYLRDAYWKNCLKMALHRDEFFKGYPEAEMVHIRNILREASNPEYYEKYAGYLQSEGLKSRSRRVLKMRDEIAAGIGKLDKPEIK